MKKSILFPAIWIYYLKLPFKHLVYELIDQLILHFIRPGRNGGVLIFRLDLLGDYLVCRPFFKSLIYASDYEGMSFTFAGNKMLQELGEKLDGKFFAEFIWIDRNRFINSIFYRFQTLVRIRRKGYSVLIYPSHTRQYWLESVVRVSGARHKITGTPIGRYMKEWEQTLSNAWYNRVIDTGKEPDFEFFRNKRFFSALSEIAAQIPVMKDDAYSAVRKKDLIIIAPGASTPERKWPEQNFSQLLRALSLEFPGYSFGLMGSESEKEVCNRIINGAGITASNYAGQTSLSESMNLLAESSLLISNESGPVHMAATTGTACVCISNGNHFSRWNPYPQSLAPNILTCYPASFGNVVENRETLIKQYHDRSALPASEVPFEAVYQAARQLLTFPKTQLL